MRKVYEDQDMTMVGYYRTVLEEDGIQTLVKNEYAQLAAGEVPFTQVYPEIWVQNDEDYERSVELIRSLRDENGDEERGAVNYKRPIGMQLVIWMGTFVVVALLVWAFCGFVQFLVS
ncbi:DUF2007 domain-containing protein [Rubritalea spongiae]|uniref:DUF2007 domain-containing protein n=1 Tax=Rubritalea spongiae TaxID=430797 RepID=A0ABW5E5K0_9BACT